MSEDSDIEWVKKALDDEPSRQQHALNRGLWTLAEEMRKLRAAS